MNHARLLEAIRWAAKLHGDQKRKGAGTPYLFHLLSVASIVADHGGTEPEILGALLHDAIEDSTTGGLRSEITRRFGEDVGALVEGCSDSLGGPKAPWRERKQAFLASLDGASSSVRLIVAADKLHNSQSTVRDLRVKGAEAWSIFRGGRDGTLWYYDAVLAALGQGWTHPILDELRRSVHELHALADPAAP